MTLNTQSASCVPSAICQPVSLYFVKKSTTAQPVLFFLPFRDAILSISGLTVFKQEAPSPTSHDVVAQQISRQNHQSPTSTQGPANANGTPSLEDSTNNQNMINNTLHQLLGHSGFSSLQNALDGRPV